MADNLRYIDEYVAASITALKEFRQYWLAKTDREFYPLHMDNWESAFTTWLVSPEAQKPTNPYTPHMRHMSYTMELDKLSGRK